MRHFVLPVAPGARKQAGQSAVTDRFKRQRPGPGISQDMLSHLGLCSRVIHFQPHPVLTWAEPHTPGPGAWVHSIEEPTRIGTPTSRLHCDIQLLIPIACQIHYLAVVRLHWRTGPSQVCPILPTISWRKPAL